MAVSVRPSGTFERASLWRLSESSSPHKCRSHLGFSLGAVGPDVTLPDGEALAVPALSAKEAGEGRETDPDEGRTGRAILPQAGIGGSESWTQADWNTQLRLAL